MEGKKYKSYTNILFNNPSFIRGLARNFDLKRELNLYNSSKSYKEADRKALYSDWLTVGNDLRNVLNDYDRKK